MGCKTIVDMEVLQMVNYQDVVSVIFDLADVQLQGSFDFNQKVVQEASEIWNTDKDKLKDMTKTEVKTYIQTEWQLEL